MKNTDVFHDAASSMLAVLILMAAFVLATAIVEAPRWLRRIARPVASEPRVVPRTRGDDRGFASARDITARQSARAHASTNVKNGRA